MSAIGFIGGRKMFAVHHDPFRSLFLEQSFTSNSRSMQRPVASSFSQHASNKLPLPSGLPGH